MATTTTTQTASGGTPLSSLLFVAFLVLKLTHVIGWSWWWVTAPLWIPLGVFGVVLVGVLLVAGLIALLD